MTQKMYLGPTIPGLIRENEIYKELPEAVKKRAEADRNFARLLLPMDEVMDARKKLEMEGSVLAVAYANVEKNM